MVVRRSISICASPVGSIEEEEVRRIFFFHHEQRGSMLDQCMNEFFSILKEFRMASNPDAEEQGKLSEEITYSEVHDPGVLWAVS